MTVYSNSTTLTTGDWKWYVTPGVQGSVFYLDPQPKQKDDMYTISTFKTTGPKGSGFRAVAYLKVDADLVPVFETEVFKTAEKAHKVALRAVTDANLIFEA